MMKEAIGSLPAVFLSESRNPAVNLAIEEVLLSQVQPGVQLLFLYENDSSVIIGRFQNPWRECNTGLLRRRGTDLRRRISGGGTVVHGPGNLNFSIVSGIPIPQKEKNLNYVIKALSKIGIKIGMNQNYDLVLQKTAGETAGFYKVSGSAFRQVSGRSMHHATLLVNADLEMLKAFLHGPERNIITRSVASNPSPVANLCYLSPSVTVPKVMEILASGWESSGEVETVSPEDFAFNTDFEVILQRLVSHEWVWEKTPGFREVFNIGYGSENLHIEIEVSRGRITRCSGLPGSDFLIGCPYHGPDLLAACPGTPPSWLNHLAAAVDGYNPEE